MKRVEIAINQGQYLSEIIDHIEPDTILCKTLTGLGATYSEIKAERNSIIVVPNIPAIVGKCAKHKADNLFGVKERVTTSDVVDYLEDTIEKKKLIKLIVTPESFYKVKNAFAEIEKDMYVNCFILLDECHKIVKDIDYRPDIALPIDDFFRFDKKALVSATPIIPSDPRFKEQGFNIVEVRPTFDYRKDIQLVHTNNMLEALRQIIPLMQAEQDAPRSICFFINSTDMIYQLITALKLTDYSSVFCSDKSVAKLKDMGFKNAYENWSMNHKRPIMFFTSRFYNALDIEMDDKPDVVFVSEPYFAEHTLVDPYTDVIQAVGRFRNGISSLTHVLSTRSTIQQRTKEGITEYINASEKAYTTIATLYQSSQSVEERRALGVALEALPYNKLLIKGSKNCFAIDNYIYDELVKSDYNNIGSVVERYKRCGYFSVKSVDPIMFNFGDHDRFTLFGTVDNKRELRKKIVDILDNIKDDIGTLIFDNFIAELSEKDNDIVDAYFTLGREVIEQNKYRMKALKRLMLIKEFHESKKCDKFREALLLTFEVGKVYLRADIKATLIKLHKDFNVRYYKTVTAETIKEYFKVKDNARIDNNRAILIIEPLI